MTHAAVRARRSRSKPGHCNVAGDRLLAVQHLEPATALEFDQETVLLDVVTSQPQMHIAIASAIAQRPRLTLGDASVPHVERRLLHDDPAYVGHEVVPESAAEQPVTIEKVVAVATSRNSAMSTPMLSANDETSQAPERGRPVAQPPGGLETAAGTVRRRRAGGPAAFAGPEPEHLPRLAQTAAASGPNLDPGVPAQSAR